MQIIEHYLTDKWNFYIKKYKINKFFEVLLATFLLLLFLYIYASLLGWACVHYSTKRGIIRTLLIIYLSLFTPNKILFTLIIEHDPSDVDFWTEFMSALNDFWTEFMSVLNDFYNNILYWWNKLTDKVSISISERKGKKYITLLIKHFPKK